MAKSVSSPRKKISPSAILGIEGGGTKTTWALIDLATQRVLKKGQAGAGNIQLMSESDLKKLFLEIKRGAGSDVRAVGGAFAGCQLPSEQKRVEKILRFVWPKAKKVRAAEDSRSALAAGFGDGPGIIVIAGTGANVTGQKAGGGTLEKVVGWGHLFGDHGSSYDLSRRGMVAVFSAYDQSKKVTILGQEFLRATKHHSLEEMVPFLLSDHSKTFIASWAECVFRAAAKGDRDARALLDDGAQSLAANTAIIARRLKLSAPGVALVGGLFEKQPSYVMRYQRALKKLLPQAHSFVLETPGVIGAARLVGLPFIASQPVTVPEATEPSIPTDTPIDRLTAYAQAATEQRNPRSHGLDKKNVSALVDLFIDEERHVEEALREQRDAIAQAADLVAKKLAAGGRLFYLGAGTSGRLGVVDASEMPPTFNASPEQIQALIAGGSAAVFQSQEGAEDNRNVAAKELQERQLSPHDIVCGIAASGQTPYVLGGLEFAAQLGAATILLTCNPARKIRLPQGLLSVEIDLPTGPEIVTGSTRLKAGTATKLVLNILSTVAMIRLGRVRDNLMINVQASNDKLRARAVRLVQEFAACDEPTAREALEQSAWRVTAALDLLQ